MRTIYGLSVTEKGEGWSGIPDKIFNAITHCYPSKESAADSARKLMDDVEGILFVEVYADTFCKDGIKREYIAKLSA
jgi:hypothetical protein